MKIPAVSRVRSKSPTFSPILLQKVPLIFPKKIIIFKIEEFSAVFLRQKLSSTVKMVPSHKNILIFSSPKKYFQIKRRSFLRNLTPENLMLSQISHIKQKIQNLHKKLKRAKIAH